MTISDGRFLGSGGSTTAVLSDRETYEVPLAKVYYVGTWSIILELNILHRNLIYYIET